MARKRETPAEKKPKVPNIEIVRREGIQKNTDALAVEAYELLDELLTHFHAPLEGARIEIAWLRNVKADADGRLRLGKPIKSADLPRQLHGVDWIVALNRQAMGMFNSAQRRALIDHELCHVDLARNAKTGETRTDALGRTVMRVRKHDIEEFREVVRRHGLYTDDLKQFYENIVESEKAPLFAHGKGTKTAPADDAAA